MQRQHTRSQHRHRKGTALVCGLVMILMICMLAAVIVDLGHIYSCKSKMQNSADAAAFAAAMHISHQARKEEEDAEDDARASALRFASYNLPSDGAVLVDDDVTFGNWNPGKQTFVKGGFPRNAVQVLVRRGGTNNDAIPTFFMNIFGVGKIELKATATAVIASPRMSRPHLVRSDAPRQPPHRRSRP